jgi:hypothetical protein
MAYGAAIMVSPLSPLQLQGQQIDITGALLGGRDAYQRSQLNQQAIQQNEQQIARADYDQAIQRLSVINRLATKVRQLPQEQRQSFVGSINQDMLRSVGIDPAQVSGVQLDDQSLDALIAQTGSAIPTNQNATGVQSSQILEDGTTIQLLNNGETRVTDPSGNLVTGEARRKAIQQANQYGVDLQSQRAGGRTSASLGARVEGGGEAQYVESLGTGRGKNVSEAEGREDVRSEQAQAALPALDRSADQAIGLVDELLNHPGRNMATGATAWVPPVPGTKQADFINRFDQIKGQAFLQAFESLKGAGQITEIEGQKATQAINRMNRSTSKEEFDNAASDFKSAINEIRQIARNKAGEKPKAASKYTIEIIE